MSYTIGVYMPVEAMPEPSSVNEALAAEAFPVRVATETWPSVGFCPCTIVADDDEEDSGFELSCEGVDRSELPPELALRLPVQRVGAVGLTFHGDELESDCAAHVAAALALVTRGVVWDDGHVYHSREEVLRWARS